MMPRHTVPNSNELDVADLARRKIEVFGCEARPIILARAENFRPHGHIKTAKFWLDVADAVAALSDPAPEKMAD
jgi:hypothetical protein